MNSKIKKPLISVVIRAKNEAEYLPRLLKKLIDQNFQDYEVILVDDHSVDDTVKIARQFGCTVVTLNEKFSYGLALNKGVEASKGELIVSIAAHAYPMKDNYLEAYVNCFEDKPEYAGLYGRQVAGDQANVLEKLERVINSTLDYNWFEPYYLNTNGCFKRSAWEKVKFPEAVWGLEDAIWCRSLSKEGYKFGYCRQAAVYHHHDLNARATVKRKLKEAKIFGGLLMGRYR